MGRHVGSSVHAVSYIIYIALNLYLALGLSLCRPADLPTCLPSSKRKYNINIEAMYIKDERWVSGSAGRHIDRPRAKYRYTSKYIIYD